MTEQEVLTIFKSEKALLTGHFLLSSGLHSPNYLQCALVLQKPSIAEKLCKALADKLSGIKIDAVIGPALGGILVSHEMGRALKVRALFAERAPLEMEFLTGRVDGSLMLRRGFSLKKNEKVVVVEDVITTGKSTQEVIELVKQSNANLVAVASIVDRSDSAAVFEAELFSLLKINIKTFKPETCPLCREGKLPVVKPGSRTLQKN